MILGEIKYRERTTGRHPIAQAVAPGTNRLHNPIAAHKIVAIVAPPVAAPWERVISINR